MAERPFTAKVLAFVIENDQTGQRKMYNGLPGWGMRYQETGKEPRVTTMYGEGLDQRIKPDTECQFVEITGTSKSTGKPYSIIKLAEDNKKGSPYAGKAGLPFDQQVRIAAVQAVVAIKDAKILSGSDVITLAKPIEQYILTGK